MFGVCRLRVKFLLLLRGISAMSKQNSMDGTLDLLDICLAVISAEQSLARK